MKRTLVGLVLFGVSFGFVEAAVVVYLRAFYEPFRQRLGNVRTQEVFPVIPLERMQSDAPEALRLLPTELLREAATILMLAAAALLAASRRGQWLPSFAIVFGVWDITFYLFLKLLIGWPASLLTWDLLFLIPVPWASPVLAPVLVSLSMIGCGLVALFRSVPIRGVHWAGFISGAGVIFYSFIEDYGNLMAGNLPGEFNWIVFFAGEALGLAAFWHAYRGSSAETGISPQVSIP